MANEKKKAFFVKALYCSQRVPACSTDCRLCTQTSVCYIHGVIATSFYHILMCSFWKTIVLEKVLWFQQQSLLNLWFRCCSCGQISLKLRGCPDMTASWSSAPFLNLVISGSPPLFSVKLLEFPPPNKPKTKITITGSRQQIQIISQINCNGSSTSWLLTSGYLVAISC